MLYPYNAYGNDGGLFGLHHNPQGIENIGLDPKKYANMRNLFRNLCDRLGERALSRNDPGNAIVTPEPVSPELATMMMKAQGYAQLPLLLYTGNMGPDDVCERILESANLIDQLRRWRDRGAVPVLTPRTITPGSIYLAQQLGIHHGQVPPATSPNCKATPFFDGIFPSLEYIENHPASINNSKVGNYSLQLEIDEDMGTNFNPEGGVAHDIKGVLRIVKALHGSGKSSMVKADLSVDGMGNLCIDLNELYNGKPLIKESDDVIADHITKRMRNQGIPLGTQAGVVVTEFLQGKIADPSVEIYSPPKQWNIRPFIYYTCEMLIEKGGFAGSIIPDQRSSICIGETQQYRIVMHDVKMAILEFAKRRWEEGYVGISDCDIAICRNKEGQLYAKILEYNYNRETGGTATYHLWQRLGNGGHGVVIARDTIRGPGLAGSISKIRAKLGEKALLYPGTGAIILGHRWNQDERDGQIMSLVYGRDLLHAIEYDRALQELAN